MPTTSLDPLKLLGFPRGPAVALPGTLALVAIATLLKFSINLFEPKSLIFATYYPALAVVTLLFGRLWGYAAVAMSVVIADYAFMEPYWSFDLGTRTGLINAVLFSVCGGFLVEICAAYRHALRRIQAKRELLAQENARTELLARELQHRSKNTAAVIASIVRQSLRGDADAANRILGRINAMYSADLLDRTSAGLCELSDVLAQECAAIEPHRVSMSGPPVLVSFELARSLAMIIHELTTNAAKYGALLVPSGEITLSWVKDGGSVVLHWQEIGGPQLNSAPNQPGFGSFLIERLLGEHGGAIEYDFKQDGLVCKLCFDVEGTSAGAAA